MSTAQQMGVQGDQYSQGQAHGWDGVLQGTSYSSRATRTLEREHVGGLTSGSLKAETNSPAYQRRVQGAK